MNKYALYGLFIALCGGTLTAADKGTVAKKTVVKKEHSKPAAKKHYKYRFNDLPEEALVHLFKNLSIGDIPTMRLVGNKCKRIIEDKTVVGYLLKKDTPPNKTLFLPLALPHPLLINQYNALPENDKTAIINHFIKRFSDFPPETSTRISILFQNPLSYLTQRTGQSFSKAIVEKKPIRALLCLHLRMEIQPTNQDYANLCDIYKSKKTKIKVNNRGAIAAGLDGNAFRDAIEKNWKLMRPYFELLERITQNYQIPKTYKKGIESFFRSSKTAKKELDKLEKKRKK